LSEAGSPRDPFHGLSKFWEGDMAMSLARLAVLCAILFTCGCGSGPEDLILGKWEGGPAGAKITAEFAKDGKAKLTMFGKPVQGTYKVCGDDQLEWTLNGKTTKYKVKITASELELTGDGNTITYKKV
jgi:hypothetical protein